MEGCIFCKIIKGQISAEKIYEDRDIVVFLDINPNTPGHSLVVPKKHFSNLLKTPDEVLAKLITAVKKIAPKILAGLNAQGFNVGVNNGEVAGQIVDHVHFHLIPRYKDDGLVHWESHTATPQQLKEIATKIKTNS